MSLFETNMAIRWADLDPNFHVMHSKYYEYGAACRMEFLMQNGLTTSWMQKNFLGPILLREECLFKKELNLKDAIVIDLKAISVSENFSRWTLQHHIYKADKQVAAIINIDGAWMDTKLRKIAEPPEEVKEVFRKALQ